MLELKIEGRESRFRWCKASFRDSWQTDMIVGLMQEEREAFFGSVQLMRWMRGPGRQRNHIYCLISKGRLL